MDRKSCMQFENDNVAWIKLHQLGVESLAKGDYDAAIDSCLQALARLDTLKATVLDTCASAYAMQSLFSKAMEATEKMIEYAPLAAAGYLHAGDTLALQGKHRRALQLYDQGMEKVPIDDEQYTSLAERKAASMTQLNKRIDFLTSLPSEIADLIIDYLLDDKEDVDFDIVCMDVSMKWRQAFADCSFSWSSFGISSSHPEKAFFTLLPLVGKHVRDLVFDDISAEQTQKLIKNVIDGHLDNVQELTIQDCDISGDTLMIFLVQLGKTLTKLTLIDEITGDHGPALGSILFACPRLKMLTYYICRGEMVFGEDKALVPVGCNIQSLDLYALLITTDVLDLTLQHCPRLQELRVRQCAGDGVRSINDHCQNLRHLRFNILIPYAEGTFVDNFSGIHDFAISLTDDVVPEHVISLLKKNQATLQSVVLRFLFNHSDAPDRWAALTEFKGKNVKNLVFGFATSAEMDMIAATVIRNCAGLQSVTLHAIEGMPDNVLGEALLMLPNLISFTVSGIWIANNKGLELFLNGVGRRGKGSSLRVVSFERCSNIIDSILEALATVTTLEQITIEQCTGATNSGLVNFFVRLSAHNTLEVLQLDDIRTVTDDVLRSLTGISSLRELDLNKLTEISADAVEDLADELESLEAFNISRCPLIGSRSLNRISKKLDGKSKAK